MMTFLTKKRLLGLMRPPSNLANLTFRNFLFIELYINQHLLKKNIRFQYRAFRYNAKFYNDGIKIAYLIFKYPNIVIYNNVVLYDY